MNSTVSNASFEQELSKAASSQSAALVDALSALTVRIKAGDASAFDIFYDTSKNYVYNNIRGLSSSITDEAAQDIMQEVYIKAFSNISSLNDPKGTLKWLKTITMNTTRDYLRKGSVRYESLIKEDEETSFENAVSESDLMEPIEIPENIVEDSATRKIVADAVMALPERQRMLMSEFYYNGKSVKDIALETGMSESAVKTQLSRTRAQLKDTFLKMEKEQGIRLHSAGIIPFVFFMFYLLTKDRTITQAAGSAVKSAVFDSAAVKSAVKAAAGAAGQAASGLSGQAAGQALKGSAKGASDMASGIAQQVGGIEGSLSSGSAAGASGASANTAAASAGGANASAGTANAANTANAAYTANASNAANATNAAGGANAPYGGTNGANAPYGGANGANAPYGGANAPYGGTNGVDAPFGVSNDAYSPANAADGTGAYSGGEWAYPDSAPDAAGAGPEPADGGMKSGSKAAKKAEKASRAGTKAPHAKAAGRAAGKAAGAAAKKGGLSAAAKGIIIAAAAVVAIGTAAGTVAVVKSDAEGGNFFISGNSDADGDSAGGTTQEVDEATLMYQTYQDKISELEDEHGKAEYSKKIDFLGEPGGYYEGLCYAELIDLDADGTDELITAYSDTEYPYYIVQVWEYENGEMTEILSERVGGYDRLAYAESAIYIFEYGDAYYIAFRYCETDTSDSAILFYAIRDNEAVFIEDDDSILSGYTSCDARFFCVVIDIYDESDEWMEAAIEYGGLTGLTEDFQITEDGIDYMMSGPVLEETLASLSEY